MHIVLLTREKSVMFTPPISDSVGQTFPIASRLSHSGLLRAKVNLGTPCETLISYLSTLPLIVPELKSLYFASLYVGQRRINALRR